MCIFLVGVSFFELWFCREIYAPQKERTNKLRTKPPLLEHLCLRTYTCTLKHWFAKKKKDQKGKKIKVGNCWNVNFFSHAVYD